MPVPTIPFLTLPNWIKAASACDIAVEPVFQQAGIEIDPRGAEYTSVTLASFEQLMRLCVERARRAHFPFVLADTYAFEYLPELETFLTTSPRLREAVQVLDWLQRLINPTLDMQLQEQGRLATLRLRFIGSQSPETTPLQVAFAESMLAAVHKFGRLLLGPADRFRAVHLRHAPPAHIDAYARYFEAELRFGQPDYALILDRALLDRPLPGGFPRLHAQARQQVERRLRHLAPTADLVHQIERLLTRQPELLGQGAEGVATALGLHLRTLQRRLAALDQPYARIEARVRHAAALQALADPARSLDAISESLGFSDRRSFTRAFQRWQGCSPRHYRLSLSVPSGRPRS